MCEYIALVVPTDADKDALESLIARHKLGRGLTGSTFLLVEPQNKCHCGTWLGYLRASTRPAPNEREIARKGKAGWSDAKIKRWLHEIGRSTELQRRDHHRKLASVGEHDSVGGWLPFIREALDSRATRELGVVVTEGLRSEWPGGLEYVTVHLDDLVPGTLLTMPQGVVHTFIPS
jgi:hypothetical protein